MMKTVYLVPSLCLMFISCSCGPANTFERAETMMAHASTTTHGGACKLIEPAGKPAQFDSPSADVTLARPPILLDKPVSAAKLAELGRLGCSFTPPTGPSDFPNGTYADCVLFPTNVQKAQRWVLARNERGEFVSANVMFMNPSVAEVSSHYTKLCGQPTKEDGKGFMQWQGQHSVVAVNNFPAEPNAWIFMVQSKKAIEEYVEKKLAEDSPSGG